MIKFFKIHIGIYRYLKAEFKKKKTPKQHILFLKQVFGDYSKFMLQEYKKLFLLLDPEFRKQKKEYERKKQLVEDLKKLLNLLHRIDTHLIDLGFPSWKRKQFRMDYFKHGAINNEVIKKLEEELK